MRDAPQAASQIALRSQGLPFRVRSSPCFATAFVIARTDAGPRSGLLAVSNGAISGPISATKDHAVTSSDTRYLHPGQHAFTEGVDLPADVSFAFCDFGLACLQGAE